MAKVGDTVKAARELKAWSQERLASESGVSKGTIQNVEGNKTKPNGATLWAIAEALGYESWEDLLAKVAGAKPFSQQPSDPSGIPVFEEIPAGSGDYDPSEHGLDNGHAEQFFPRALIPAEGYRVSYAVRVKGDSMAPKYFDGDLVFCSDDAPHTSGMVAAVRLADGSATLKFVDDVDQQTVRLRPANERYTSKLVNRELVTRMHRVVGSYRREAMG